ncbi:hypothetical protein [Ensifer aridi]|uniref:hypothetical protein n=1 Tax=Ensifer aridi TaxID=1708715 RepID=UPI000A10E008|nr:hypothetical protein [Ensifer aridi]
MDLTERAGSANEQTFTATFQDDGFATFGVICSTPWVSRAPLVTSLQCVSQRTDEGINVALQRVNMRRNPQALDVLDLAVLHVHPMLVPKIALKLFHVEVVDREQAYRSKAVRVGGGMEPETGNVAGETQPVPSEFAQPSVNFLRTDCLVELNCRCDPRLYGGIVRAEAVKRPVESNAHWIGEKLRQRSIGLAIWDPPLILSEGVIEDV